MTVLSQLAEAGGLGANDNREWVELPDGARALPNFPTDALPDDLAQLVHSIAGAYQAPEGLAAAFALGVAGSAIVGRVEIQPKEREPFYTEAGQLYVLCQGASGERKTPVLNALKAPLERWLDERREAIRTENADHMRRIKALEKEAAHKADADRIVSLDREADALRQTLKPEPEYLLADLTMEAVSQAMEDHQGRAAVVFDEADFLAVLSGKQYQRFGACVNLLPALSGYTNSPLHGKRVGRGEWHISRASLAICLGVQPRILRDFMEDAGGIDRGLHARFLYFLPESKIGTRSSSGGSLPSSIMAWWTCTINRLAGIARDSDPMLLQFDSYAESAYRAFFDRIEARLVGDMGGAMQSWGSKLAGNTVRLAGILALLDGQDTVGRKHWDGAETIADEYLIPCAVGLFLGADPYLSEDARKLLEKIRGLKGFKASELYRDKARHIPLTTDGFMNSLDNLEQQGYIRKAARQEAYCGRGAKPSPIYEVHPALYKQTGKSRKEVEL